MHIQHIRFCACLHTILYTMLFKLLMLGAHVTPAVPVCSQMYLFVASCTCAEPAVPVRSQLYLCGASCTCADPLYLCVASCTCVEPAILVCS
jgi:hypothetical protein